MRGLLLLVVFLLCAGEAAAQSSLTVTADPNAGHRGVLRVRDILADDELEDAIRSGLPLRLRFRVELWRDALFDDLISTEQWTAVLTFDPLSELYVVRIRADAPRARAFTDFAAARAVVETAYPVSLRPQKRGRYYYTGSVDIETLSLSDLEELERWLKGELQPAVSGDRSLPGAIGQGARRLFIRVLSLPERRLEARSERFRMP
jgi:Domain of unknown function (DUF4390)